MHLKFRILNVFTAGGARLSGNPLCVVEDGSELDGAAMQTLARQFNLSETTFILPSKRAAALVRILTPAYEMPFAGQRMFWGGFEKILDTAQQQAQQPAAPISA